MNIFISGLVLILITPFVYILANKLQNLIYLLITFICCEFAQGMTLAMLLHKFEFASFIKNFPVAVAFVLYVLMNTTNHTLLIYHAIKRVSDIIVDLHAKRFS